MNILHRNHKFYDTQQDKATRKRYFKQKKRIRSRRKRKQIYKQLKKLHNQERKEALWKIEKTIRHIGGSHQEEIICPECNTEQTAEVLHTFPFWSYVHHCIKCEHIIMESEWEKKRGEKTRNKKR